MRSVMLKTPRTLRIAEFIMAVRNKTTHKSAFFVVTHKNRSYFYMPAINNWKQKYNTIYNNSKKKERKKKYLSTTLTKHAQGVYTENCNMLMKEITEILNKCTAFMD